MQENPPPPELTSLGPSRALGSALVVALGSVALLTVALWVLFPSQLPLEDLGNLLANTQPLGLLGGLLVMTVGMVFVAFRWRVLMPQAEHVGSASLTGIVCAGLMLNYALPGPVGELGAALLVRHRHGIPATTALAASVHARMIGLGLAGVLAACTFLFADLPIPEEHHRLVAVVTVCIGLGAVTLGLLSAFPSWIRVGSERTLGRFGPRLPKAAWWAKTHDVVVALADALGSTGRVGWVRYTKAAFFALGAHASVTVGIYISCLAMGMHPYPPGILFTYCAATAAVVALIAFPGSQLGWDALFLTFLLATTELEPVQGLAVVALVRLQQVVLLAVGAASLGWEGGFSASTDTSAP